MKTAWKIASIIAGCCILAWARTGYAVSPQDALASYDWSVSASPNLATNPAPKDLVAAFVASGAYLTSEQASAPYSLCAFTFADLRHNGTLSLLASVDDSGRFCGRTTLIIDKTPGQFEVWAVGGGSAKDESSILKDLAGDGNLEMVLKGSLTGWMGAGHCEAVWPVIYGWTGSGYANISSKFTSFYQAQLAALNAQIAALPPPQTIPPEASDPAFDADCLKAEPAKIQRILGSPDAGLSQAGALVTSSNHDDLAFALFLLADINTPSTVPYLTTLSTNPDPIIANLALGQLAQPHNGVSPPQPTQYLSVAFGTAPIPTPNPTP